MQLPATTLHALLRRVPRDRAALHFGDAQWSYGQLADEAGQLAAGLHAQGLVPGDVLGLWLPSTPRWLLMHLACAMLGVTTLSLNPRLGVKELVDFVDRARCKALGFDGRLGIAGFYVVVARTAPGKGAGGLSALLVDADTPGLAIHRRIDIVAPHPLAEIRFDQCRVPAHRLIGAPGEGFKAAMAVLDIFRNSVGAAAVGMGRRALDETLARMSTRQLYGQPMSGMDTVRHKVADMAVPLEGARLLVRRAAWLRDVRGRRITAEAAMAKLQGTVVERLYREIRPMRIYEGATEVQKTLIGRQLLRGAA